MTIVNTSFVEANTMFILLYFIFFIYLCYALSLNLLKGFLLLLLLGQSPYTDFVLCVCVFLCL